MRRILTLPQVQNQGGVHSWLRGLPLWNVVEEELTVGDRGQGSLPAFLHAAGLRDLRRRREDGIDQSLPSHSGKSAEWQLRLTRT